jgi:hypothetical protein
MKNFRIPFLNRGGAVLYGPNEGIVYMSGTLGAKLIPGSNHKFSLRERIGRFWNRLLRGDANDYGIVSRRVVTTAGVNYMRDDFAAAAGGADITNFKYHDSGTGTNAEAVGDTTLQTQAGPATRATGTQDNSVSKQYKTVGTINYTSTLAITEHGIFNQAAQGGTLWDRSVFSAINVVNGDSIQFTYTLTINDGG